MITELFYPRELNETISELKEKGDLNVQAESLLKLSVYKNLAIFLLMPLILLFTEYAFFSAVILVFIPLFMRFDLKKYKRQKVYPYLRGEKVDLTIKKRSIYRGGIQLSLIDENGKEYKTPLLRELAKVQNCRNIGERISVFILPDVVSSSMPNIPDLRNKYCLSLSIAKESCDG